MLLGVPAIMLILDPPNVPPVITTDPNVTVDENVELVLGLVADQDVTWSIIGGADAARFELFGAILRWVGNGTKDFEFPDDANADNSYVVSVRATSAFDMSDEMTITVTVQDVAVEGGAGSEREVDVLGTMINMTTTDEINALEVMVNED